MAEQEKEKVSQNQTSGETQQALRWHFWFLAVFSAFLFVTFVLYLPLRFEHQALGDIDDVHDEVMDEYMEEQEHMGGDEHGAATVFHEENEIREGLVVNLNVSPAPVVVGELAKLDFFVNEKPGNMPVTNLEIEHSKFMHVIGVRDDLNEFFHIHPEAVSGRPGFWTTAHTFQNPGTYKIWSEVRRAGENHSFGHPQFAVTGDGEQSKKTLTFAKNVIVDDYQVGVDYPESVVKGKEIDVIFDVHDLYGVPVALEPYLEADMHLAIIKDDLTEFIHTHPEEGHGHVSYAPLFNEALAHGPSEGAIMEEAEEVSFHVTFPEQGIYKLFAQFRPKGANLPPDEALTAAFYVKVGGSQVVVPSWWRNLIVSLLLIVVLSWFVKKYITVPPAIAGKS